MNNLSKREEFPIDSWERKKDLLKNTICKGATDDEFELFSSICQRSGLDPFMKQIYPVKRWDSNLKRESMTIQTSIDGFRLIAERTGRYSPGKEPLYTYDKEGNLLSATSYIKKQTPDKTWHEVSATAYWEEYVVKTKEGKPSQFWLKMPHLMLAKCAEALALRKAFPAELSKIYTHDEMAQATNVEEAEPVQSPLEPTIIPIDTSARERLIERLNLDEQEVEHLDTFLYERSESTKRPVQTIIKAALMNDRMIELFKKIYLEWLKENSF